MTDLDTITGQITALRASLDIDAAQWTLADRRLLRAQIEHCILDLQRLLAQLIAPSDAALDDARQRSADLNAENQIS